ncbi:hypothetical protein E2C01_083413 [Portunus trituberculatus]|uniref:Uncharacterized protein n=1 Tax=Portunus trituberculatus TaxID=210409 RepID=A0A5B7J4L3_PORTR|nr:hypothetical protein [Portunus trituberculatus]
MPVERQSNSDVTPIQHQSNPNATAIQNYSINNPTPIQSLCSPVRIPLYCNTGYEIVFIECFVCNASNEPGFMKYWLVETLLLPLTSFLCPPASPSGLLSRLLHSSSSL